MKVKNIIMTPQAEADFAEIRRRLAYRDGDIPSFCNLMRHLLAEESERLKHSVPLPTEVLVRFNDFERSTSK